MKKPTSLLLEDSIMVKDEVSSGGSKILYNFTAPFGATVVERAESAGVAIVGRVSMPEFGFPSLFETAPKPDALTNTGAGKPPILCNDYAGQYRRLAPAAGLSYLLPTYGTVSRFGLIAAVSSMDQIGVLGGSVEDAIGALSVIAGYDPKDGTSRPEASGAYEMLQKALAVGLPETLSGLRVAVLKTAADKLNAQDAGAFAGVASQLAQKGALVSPWELPLLDILPQTWLLLSSAELSNNISRFDGIKFGYRTENFRTLSDVYVMSRSETFGYDTKTACILGSMALSEGCYEKYYVKAMQLRRLLANELNALWETADVLLLPATFGADVTAYDDLSLTAIASLAGCPSLSLSCAGVGIQLVARPLGERALFSLGLAMERLTGGKAE